MASPRPSRLAALAAVTLAAAFAKATSIVPPENLGELARMSDAVVLAQAGSSSAVPAGPLLFTHTTFRVMEAVTGTLSTGDHIEVRVPGGDLADSGWLVPGAPRFDPGQVYLLFLHRKNTGQWLPQAMAYGLLRRVAGRDGSILLAPVPEAADVEPFPRPDGILPEKVETYREATLVAHLRAVASGSAEWSARRVLAAGDQVPIEVQAQSVPSSCRYITAPNPPSPTPPPPFPRWPYNTSSSPGQVNIYYSPSGGDASVSGGGIAQLQGAVNGWMGIPNISLDLAYAGLKSGYTMRANPPSPPSCMTGSRPRPLLQRLRERGGRRLQRSLRRSSCRHGTRLWRSLVGLHSHVRRLHVGLDRLAVRRRIRQGVLRPGRQPHLLPGDAHPRTGPRAGLRALRRLLLGHVLPVLQPHRFD